MRISDIKGKTAIVTGASSGIGLQFCNQLAFYGCNIVMISNQQPQLNEAARDISEKFNVKTWPLFIDLTNPDAPNGIEIFLDANKIKAEILINNAGIFSFSYLANTPTKKINTFIDLHVRSVTFLTDVFAKRFAGQGSGWILNMSSMSCWMPMPGIALYSATKAYIRVLSRALNYEMKSQGVNIMVACPGGIATDLFGISDKLMKLAVRIKAIQTPEQFTKNALKHLFRGKAQYINGPLNRFAIFLIGITPRPVRMLIKTQLLDKGITR
ncbi:MAG: SDR family NAD(P)-dependent oxidoreductase [Prevotella sp.]|nr:SDR family NAD(P)-dependent oxidoreductase [Bacteroides sp.]MCM1365734.1 SDR family NAD(P)-dependent oxidoreductase [Prevotella sp.]MCM1436404.1 SDR family NAD(P)-dependent oxidoreductase [Prevotella sp.]